MYYQNNEDEKIDIEQHNEDIVRGYPSYKFRQALVDNRYFWSVDGLHYFFLMDDTNYDTGESMQSVAAVVKMNCIPISYLSQRAVEKHTVHIQYICIRNDWRNLGILGAMSKLIQEQVDEHNIFIHFHSRPYHVELPQVVDPDSAMDWAENHEGKHTASYKKDKEDAKKMRQAYRRLGYCYFDGYGIGFRNRVWKDYCLGYAGANIGDESVARYVDNHLRC